MHVDSGASIGSVIALLRKEIAERQTALYMLEALIAGGTSPASAANGVPLPPLPVAAASGPQRRKRPTQSIARAAVELLRATGRPMHGLREIIPALEAQGYKFKHKTGLATTLMRTGKVDRTAPGTFALKSKELLL